MSRPWIAALALAPSLATWSCASGESAEARAERVVLVTIDTLRADHVGCYGAEAAHTPRIDELAATGVRFESAIAPAPITLVSHASMFTGLEPPRHGIHHNTIFRLAEDIPTLAEQMRASGRATAAFVGAVPLDRRYGLARGFDRYGDRMSLRWAGGADSFAERTADQVVAEALSWLENAPPRFFLWVHLFDPHADYRPPPGFQAVFPDDPYAGEIAFADSQLGRLLDAIERRHPDGRTLVAVTSDHGEGLGDHGEVTHSLGIYDTTQRVPLVLNGPGVPGATVVRRTVGLVDLAPTLLALVGAEPLAGTDGVDLVGSWSGDASEARPVYVETLATQIDFGWSALLGIRSGRYKYIRAPRPELYDIENDPGETRDLSTAHPERMAELSAILDERLAAAGELAPAIDPDPAARARLRELGYLAGEPAVPVELGPVGGLDPKDGMADALRLMRAMVLRGQGRPLAALGVLENIEGGGHMVNLFRSAAALELGNAEAAERFAREAVAERPAFANGHVLLGEALAARGRAERAAASYEEALRIEPGLPAASIGLGRLAEARGDRREAARLYERAVGSRQGSAEGAWRLAALRIETGEDAAALLDEVGDLAYSDPEAALRLARAERAAGRGDAAEARLRKAFRQNRRSAALARELGAVRRR